MYLDCVALAENQVASELRIVFVLKESIQGIVESFFGVVYLVPIHTRNVRTDSQGQRARRGTKQWAPGLRLNGPATLSKIDSGHLPSRSKAWIGAAKAHAQSVKPPWDFQTKTSTIYLQPNHELQIEDIQNDVWGIRCGT